MRFPPISRSLILAACLLHVTAKGEIPDGPALVEQYCFECHGDGSHKGDLDLDELLAAPPEDSTARRGWQKAWKITRHEFMPPAKADRPSDTERIALTRWIETARLGIDPARPDPGRVTMRRLNRMEYEFSATDLFGTDLSTEREFSSDEAVSRLRLRDRLPPDDTAYGFDNIGDFQTLSPALLEKYLELAEDIVDRVVSVEGPQFPVRPLAGPLESAREEEPKRLTQSLGFEVADVGTYEIRVRFSLGGWDEFGGAYDFAFQTDDTEFSRDMIEVGGQKTHRYTGAIALTPGPHQIRFVTTARKPDSEGRLRHLELRPDIRLVGPMDSAFATFPESHRRIFFDGEAPTEAEARRAYAREILRRVAVRAFRRPVDAATLDRLTDIALSEPQFERGIAQALTGILASPRFLFRSESQPQPNDADAIHPLDEWALASRLSYFLWLSIPDEELNRLAGEGKLHANLRAQVHRMLDDPKSARFFEDFPGQWLRTRNVLMTSISRDSGPLDPVRGAMKRETEMLFEHIARNDRDLLELVTADYTFVDRGLAAFYGLRGYEGEGFQKVSLPAESHRGGILTHGSFLVSTSNPNRTSPVKRGLYVLESLFGTQPPPPPANVPPLEEGGSSRFNPKTVREQLAAHREDQACAACHAHFDPIGIVLEHYDLIGRWRDEEKGQPIIARETTVTGETLEGIGDLRGLFTKHKDKFYRCVTEKLLTYALGRGLEPFDASTVDRIAAEVAAEGGKFSTLLVAVIESPAFQTRRGDDGRALDTPNAGLPETPPLEVRKGRRRFRPEDFQKESDTGIVTEPLTTSPEVPPPASPGETDR